MYRFLCIVALFALSASAASDKKKCEAAADLGLNVLRTLSINYVVTQEDPSAECYGACLLMQYKLVKSDGSMNVDAMTKHIPKNVANRVEIIDALKVCSKERGEDICDTVYKSYECLKQKEALHPHLY